jgi:hypothetical protein
MFRFIPLWSNVFFSDDDDTDLDADLDTDLEFEFDDITFTDESDLDDIYEVNK